VCLKVGDALFDVATTLQKDVFRRGDLLARTVGATSERLADDSAVRQLLNLAVQRRADSMLADVARIMRGERGAPSERVPILAASADHRRSVRT
jgi:hypothetical protein